MMIRMMKRLILTLLLFLCTTLFSTSPVQTAELQNAVDWRHPWVSATNPATIPWQPARISFGLKAFQMGFLPDQTLGLTESRLNASLPFYLPFDFGVGVDLKYYIAGAYAELTGGLLISRKILDNFALGIKTGLIQTGFSRSNFNLVHADDPLLGRALTQTSFDFGLGLHWNPGKLSLGTGFEHLNQPDIGIHSKVALPVTIYGALGYQFGPVTPSFLIQHDGRVTRTGMGVAVRHPNLGTLRLGYQSEMPFKIELQLNLGRKHLMQYGVDLPAAEISAVSMGSHELAYTYVIGKGPVIGQPELIISTNELKIIEETIVRSLPRDILPSDLANSGEIVPEFLLPESRLNNMLIVCAGALGAAEDQQLRTKRYITFAKEIRVLMHKHPNLNVIIRANRETLKDARTIKHLLETKKIVPTERIRIAQLKNTEEPDFSGFRAGKEMTAKKQPRLSVKELVISMIVPGKTRKLKRWDFSILNEREQSIRAFTGKNKLPETLNWDWCDETGRLIPAGQYKCRLVVQTPTGQKKEAVSSILNVIHLKRKVTFKFHHRPNMLISTN